jgi:hypothetical protein
MPVIRPRGSVEAQALSLQALKAAVSAVIVCVHGSALLDRSSSVGWTRKEDQVLIRIRDDKGSGAPRLLLECLMERESCSLIIQEKLFDLARGSNRDGSGKQTFALANIAREHRLANQPQVESCTVPHDLRIERRIAIDECDREAELASIKVAGTLDGFTAVRERLAATDKSAAVSARLTSVELMKVVARSVPLT